MTRWTMLASIPLFALAVACGSNDADSDATGGAGGSAGESGSAGEAGAAGDGGASGSDGGPSCEGTQSTDEKLSAAMAILRDELAKAGVPGGAIAIVKDGKLVDLGVTGSKRASECDPITPDTLFRTVGLTQVITSIAVLDAVEDEMLSLEAPITQLIPTLGAADESNGSVGDITLHHLLTDSSMYATRVDEGATWNVGSDCRSSIAESFADPTRAIMYAPPGSMANMLWSDYELAGLALEVAEDKPFADVVADRVLEPLGMGGAFDTAAVLASDHALPHDPTEQLLQQCPNRYPSEHYHGSIRDVVKLAEYLTGGAGEILAPPMVDAMLSEQGPWILSFVHSTYGMAGFRASAIGDEEVFSSTFGFGFKVEFSMWRQRRLAVIALMNRGGWEADTAGINAAFAVAKIYDPSLDAEGSTYRTYDSPPTPESLPSLVGSYEDGVGFKGSGERTLDVLVDPNDASKLLGTIIDSSGTSFEVSFDPVLCADLFLMEAPIADPPAVRFWRDDAGAAYALSMAGNLGPPFFRVPTTP